MTNLSVALTEHKRFLIEAGAAVLITGLFFLIFVRPASRKASDFEVKGKKSESAVREMFKGPENEHPTEALKRQYQKMQGDVRTREEELIRDVGFPIEAPFIIPQSEAQKSVYFVSVHDRTKDEIKNRADLGAIELADYDLGFDKMPRDEEAGGALATLAVVRRAALEAIEARVSSVVKVLLKTGKDRSVQIHDRRIEEREISMEVRGTPDSIMRWMKGLHRRGSYLLVVNADITGLKDSPEAKAVVEFSAITVTKAEKSEDDEEETGTSPRRY